MGPMRGSAVVLLLALGGCQLFRAKDTRPPMPPPMPAHAPYEYRHAQYVAVRGTKVDRDYLGFSLQHSMYTDHYLLLGNGRKVWDIDELGPHVGAETELGRTLAERKRASARERRTYMIGGGAVAAGAAFFLLGGLTVKGDGPIPAAVPFTLGAVGLFGGLGYLVFGPHPKQPPADIDEQMLETYNQSLAETLRICVDGLAVKHCDAPPFAPTLAPPGSP